MTSTATSHQPNKWYVRKTLRMHAWRWPCWADESDLLSRLIASPISRALPALFYRLRPTNRQAEIIAVAVAVR